MSLSVRSFFASDVPQSLEGHRSIQTQPFENGSGEILLFEPRAETPPPEQPSDQPPQRKRPVPNKFDAIFTKLRELNTQFFLLSLSDDEYTEYKGSFQYSDPFGWGDGFVVKRNIDKNNTILAREVSENMQDNSLTRLQNIYDEALKDYVVEKVQHLPQKGAFIVEGQPIDPKTLENERQARNDQNRRRIENLKNSLKNSSTRPEVYTKIRKILHDAINKCKTSINEHNERYEPRKNSFVSEMNADAICTLLENVYFAIKTIPTIISNTN
jgi:hypothetical protein